MKKLLFWLVIPVTIMFFNPSNAQTVQPGSGYALNFNGLGNYVDCGPIQLDTSDFSVEGWYNFPAISNNRGLMGTWIPGFPWPSYFYLVYGFTGPNNLTATFHINGPAFNTNLNYNTTSVLGWHHIACTFKRRGKMTLYLDGIARDSVSISFGGGQSIDAPGATFQIGTVGGNALFFIGGVDEVRIWKKLLSATDIRDKMCMKLKGTEAGLKAYWRMDEGSGNTIFDSSTSGYNGTTY